VQQFAVFIQKIHLPVMFLLIFDIFDQHIFFTHGMRERAVTLLPMTKSREHVVLLDPFCTAGFDRFDQIGQRNRRMNRSQNMDVVFHAIQPE